MNQVVHAFKATLIILAVGMINEAGDNKHLLEVIRIELFDFFEKVPKLHVVLWKRLGLSLQPSGHHLADLVPQCIIVRFAQTLPPAIARIAILVVARLMEQRSRIDSAVVL